ncbi:hypothetical protein [Magnetofaba australis]|uniref:Uncharacterized protein n=1 Tax=Magnetofaba australis IT-1 TaxID=1434232 RepID=A0A1Y2KBW4_9PROT|nr:hypothetical protein [Magnetofaba australis]OSM07625.1 hypothetical protein MAIT1_04396 [Magnetofaba australis IT-1]
MDTTILNHQERGNNPPMPETRIQCREMIITLQSEIDAIRDQIAASDLKRQARGEQLDPEWFHRARTALRFKKEKLARIKAHMQQLPGGKSERNARLKDAIIATVRADYDEQAWREVLDEAHLRLEGGA